MSRPPLPRDTQSPRAAQRDTNWTQQVEEHPPPDVRQRLRTILLKSDLARCKDDYEFLDRYVHTVTYFADLPPRERLRYLRIVKGVELERGEELFHIGDPADAFYCIMYGSLNVVVDFSHAAVPSMNGFDEMLNRARLQSTYLNSGGGTDLAQNMTYVVRFMKALECFGDVGLLTSDQQRTASVVANEKSLCMKVERDVFLELRKSYSDRELREKIKFLASIPAFEHWDADNILRLTGRMEKVSHSYNDVIVKEGAPANHFYFVKHGECRLVKQFPMLRIDKQRCFVELGSINSRHFFGAFEVITGVDNAQFSVLVSSPSAVLYRMDRVDFRQTVLKDPTTEAVMRSECVELTHRLTVDNVRKDLESDVRWSQYKRELVSGILESHQRNHTSALHGQRSPRLLHPIKARPPEITMVPVVKTHCSALPTSPHSRPGRMLVDPQRPSQPSGPPSNNAGSPRRWLTWAKQRATTIVQGEEPSGRQAEGDAELVSNIEWGAVAQIMGGMDDGAMITSAIVSLFDPHETHAK